MSLYVVTRSLKCRYKVVIMTLQCRCNVTMSYSIDPVYNNIQFTIVKMLLLIGFLLSNTV